MNKKLKNILIILLWLCLFEILAMLVQNSILLVGPVAIGKTWVSLLLTKDFYRICLVSLLRIMTGMVCAFLSGMICGALAYKFEWFFDLINPVLSVMKSIPVASFVVLLLIWQGAQNLSVFICFLVVFPNVCVSTKNGLGAVDKELMEVAKVFDIKGFQKFWYFYRPSLIPYLISCMEISIGMSFKSGVAAEVIGTPDYSIGERIYVSKIYLDTAGLAAWTFTLILLSFLVEKAVLFILKQGLKPTRVRVPASSFTHVTTRTDEWEKRHESSKTKLVLQNVSKAYDQNHVLDHINATLQKGNCYLLMAPSGSGKTTLLRILSGLTKADAGNIIGNDRITYQFQEDRLLDNELTITNIMLTAKRENLFIKIEKSNSDRKPLYLKNKIFHPDKNVAAVFNMASEILPGDCLFLPAASLSGGMKRRVSLIRALLYHFDQPETICLLDEPFAGLDAETKKKTIAFIRKYQNGRTLIITSHEEEDCRLLGGTIWKL